MGVVFLVLDGLPLRHVTAAITPTLHMLAQSPDNAWALHGGRAVMASSTYSNHRTFVTGVAPVRHGVAVNRPIINGVRVAAEDVALTVPTVFDVCRCAGRSVEAVFGDHHLVGVMGAASADRHFPHGGMIPSGAPLDQYGYIDDPHTLAELLGAIEREPDLIVAQLNRPDTYGHIHGPDSTTAHEHYRTADADVAAVIEALQPRWNDTTLIIVSDHDQEMITVGCPNDLAEFVAASGVHADVSMDGTAAMVAAQPGHEQHVETWLNDVARRRACGVAGVQPIDPGRWLVWAEPGGWFAPTSWAGAMVGVHGGIHTLAQVALVTGGDPRVAAFAHAFDHDSPDGTDWAPAMLGLLGLSIPT